VDLSGSVNAAQANNVGAYRLVMPGKKGSFVAKNAKTIKLKSATYNDGLKEITLTPNKPFALKKGVELQVNGSAPVGLQDSQGRLIDGNHDGVPGGNAIAVLRSNGVALTVVVSKPSQSDTAG
jgi:hypothetical protein